MEEEVLIKDRTFLFEHINLNLVRCFDEKEQIPKNCNNRHASSKCSI